MRVRLTDSEALRRVTARSVRIYLLAHDWLRPGDGDRSGVWTLGDGETGFQVLPPSSDQVPDFTGRVSEILRVLAAAEDRSELEILRELLQARFDVQSYRLAYPGPEGTAPLNDAANALKAAQSMLASAAATVELSPRLVLPHRSPARSADLVKRSLAGPTSEGSYRLSVWVPVPPRLRPDEDMVLFEIDGDPFERIATRRLHEALTSLADAVEDADSIDTGIEAFTDRVEHGLTANLCEAVASALGESEGGLEASFAWSIDRPVRVQRPRVRFIREHQNLLLEAAREIREMVPEEEVRLVGNVVRLHRDGETGSGDITIAGVIVDDLTEKQRRVTVSLAAPEYEQAIQAHQSYDAVEVVGELFRKGTRSYLRNARNFLTRPMDD